MPHMNNVSTGTWTTNSSWGDVVVEIEHWTKVVYHATVSAIQCKGLQFTAISTECFDVGVCNGWKGIHASFVICHRLTGKTNSSHWLSFNHSKIPSKFVFYNSLTAVRICPISIHRWRNNNSAACEGGATNTCCTCSSTGTNELKVI